MSTGRLWGARFRREPSEEVIAFLAGRDVAGMPPADAALVGSDILGSRAHVVALCERGLITKKDGQAILRALHRVEGQCAKGEFRLDPSKEDVHTNVEAAVTQICGVEHGGKIHTGRSRNDQVAVDLRLFLRDVVLSCAEDLAALALVLTDQAVRHAACVMPAYTHHQHATFTTFGHLLACYAHQLARDLARLKDWYGLYNRSPLGAAAGYGTSLSTDRQRVADFLGFDAPHQNSLDSVTSRQEAEAHLGFALGMVMVHLGSMSQTLLLLSTAEFGMVRMDDAYCTGSSIMPQKKNPDCLEIIKGKAAVAQGRLVSLLALTQSSFMGYNREAQLGKYVIMDLVADVGPCIGVMRGIIKTLRLNAGRMADLCKKGFLGATALTEYLCAKKALPFRIAKQVVERGVRYSEDAGLQHVSFDALAKGAAELGAVLQVTPDEVQEAQDAQAVLTRQLSSGSPSLLSLQGDVRQAAATVKSHRAWVKEARARIARALRKLERAEKRILA